MAAADRTLKALADRLLDLDGIIEQNQNVTNEEDTYEFVERMKNEKTKQKTKSDVKRVKQWLESIGEHRELYEIPAPELNNLLARMFLGIRKVKDNSEYEPDTLRSIQSSISRHLTDHNYEGNILTDLTFKHSRDVISSKKKFLKEQGMGNKRQRSDPFTDDEIKILRDKHLLGSDTPQALVNAIWLNNTTHFGLRGRQEHTTMLWGDLELGCTSNGREYLAFTERSTKTRNGIASDTRAFVPKMFSQPDDEFCPVKLYKLFADKRPENMRAPDSRFHIAINPRYGKGGKNDDVWFVNGTMGKNRLGQIGKRMAEDAQLSGRHTNHSGRKTFITKLLNANVPPTDVAQLSGHKNLMSLNQYNTVGINRQIEMSTIVHHVTSSGDSNETNVNTRNSYAKDYVTEYDNSVSDSDLIACSQEVEHTLNVINTYEAVKYAPDGQVVDLPVIHNADGSLSVSESKMPVRPESLFVNCQFHCPVNVVFK